METFDTNVLIRLLVADDRDQTALAQKAWARALVNGGVLVPLIVLAECVWVLRISYRLDRTIIASKLERLISIQGVQVESPALVRRALRRFHSGPAGFADYLILEIAAEEGALPVRTFDRKLARAGNVEAIA